jgi:hypothetical protein
VPPPGEHVPVDAGATPGVAVGRPNTSGVVVGVGADDDGQVGEPPPFGVRFGVRFGCRGRFGTLSRACVGAGAATTRARDRGVARRSREAGGVRRSSRTGASTCGRSDGPSGTIIVSPAGGGPASATAPGSVSENVPDVGGPASATKSVSTAAEPIPAERR